MRQELPVRATLCVALLLALAFAANSPTIAAGSSTKVQRASPDAPLDLNSASEEALTTIPGIGRTMAKRIITWREEHGPFQRVEDLMKVKGVGDKTFDKLRPYVRVKKSR